MKRIVLSGLLLLLMVSPALAHKVSVYATMTGNLIEAEGYFFDGTPCVECAINVTDPATGALLQKGQTAKDGTLAISLPQTYGEVRLDIDAGNGHGGSYLVSSEDTAMESTGNASTVSEPAVLQESAELSIEQQELRRMIDEAVVRETAGLREQVRELRQASQRPGMTEILGGIGYIVGMLGLWAYFQSKVRNK